MLSLSFKKYSLFLSYFYSLLAFWEGHYKSDGKIWRGWEMSRVKVHYIKFSKNLFLKKEKILFRK